jgi:predicted RNA-binding protein with PUA-like domain
MLAYLREPADAAVWGRALHAGLRRLTTYSPQRASPGDPSDYRAFCTAAAGLMRDYEIPPELLDYIVSAAASYKPEAIDLHEGSRVWVFQANPSKYDIDGALVELAEIEWTVRQYSSDVHIGDRVYIWKSGAEGGVIATAEVATEPEVRAKTDDPYVTDPDAFAKPGPIVTLHIAAVLPQPLLRSDLLEHPILNKLGVLTFPNATNFAVTPAQDTALLALLEGKDVPGVQLPDVTDTVAANVFLPKAWLDGIVGLLRAKRQLIFYGPPGTGKTFVAQELAKDIVRDGGNLSLVQFHPSYSYEDFFEGYRPFELDGGAGLGYRLTHGPLRRLADDAAANPSRPYILIVDEINRGNVPKIFGELLFLLEYRDKKIALQYSPEEPFSLPQNLFVIGTMNTVDRSIALVDAALRRRFYFVPFLPNEPPVSGVLPGWLAHHGHIDDEPARLLATLNAAIGDQEIAIGPSYFMGANGAVPDLNQVWEHAIEPLLEEHYYGTGVSVRNEFGLAALRKKLTADEGLPSKEALEEEPSSSEI